MSQKGGRTEESLLRDSRKTLRESESRVGRPREVVCGARMTAEPYGTRESLGVKGCLDSEPPAGNAGTPLRILLVIRLRCSLLCFLFQISLRVTIGFCCKAFTQRKTVHSLLPLIVVWSYFRKLDFSSMAVFLSSPVVIGAHNPIVHAHLHVLKCKFQAHL